MRSGTAVSGQEVTDLPVSPPPFTPRIRGGQCFSFFFSPCIAGTRAKVRPGREVTPYFPSPFSPLLPERLPGGGKGFFFLFSLLCRVLPPRTRQTSSTGSGSARACRGFFSLPLLVKFAIKSREQGNGDEPFGLFLSFFIGLCEERRQEGGHERFLFSPLLSPPFHRQHFSFFPCGGDGGFIAGPSFFLPSSAVIKVERIAIMGVFNSFPPPLPKRAIGADPGHLANRNTLFFLSFFLFFRFI